jgi:transcription-repair coupling factor (superfamily II helicase)
LTDRGPILELGLPDRDRPKLVWSQLFGAAASLAAAEIIARHSGTVCVIARSATALEQLEREIEFFAGARTTRRFPDYETLPYEAISAPKDLLAERLATLHELTSNRAVKLVVNAEALLGRLPPPSFIGSRSLSLETGQTLKRDELTERLVHHGYLRVDQVAEPGEFAVRGALLDLYPTGAEQPVRIDLLDEEIESLRLFDPETQRSRGATERVRILPAREFPFDAAAIRGFRERYREYFPGEPGRSAIYRGISESLLPAGIEYYLPLFFPTTSSLVDYLPDDTLIVEIEDALESLGHAWQLVEERYEQLRGDLERPLLAPAAAFWAPAELAAQWAGRPTVRLSARAELDTAETTLPAGTAHPLSAQAALDLDRVDRWLAGDPNERTLLVASSPGRREVLLEFLRNRGYEVRAVSSWHDFRADTAALGVAVGELECGLRLPAYGIRVVTAAELGMERPRQQARRRRTTRDPEAVIRELTALAVGAPVVHEDYGVGRYQGLVMLPVDAVPTEFLLLEYADGDKLYVPVQSLHLITRYTGAGAEDAPLHKLGTDQWLKAKRKAAERARDVAAELLNVYAQRAARQGTRLARDAESYAEFARAFPFEETDDQLAAIEQVVADLDSGKPMDRVVCGDVGFGKTEVALRAAFVAAQAGFQVAVLVPTTLLAQQHHQTFTDRFADWPIQIELLSRFRSSKESQRVLDGLTKGTIDIVIGTHKLLQADVRFKNLGAVIIDEEHRFGVKHKERLKRLRSEVHVLTMTATPIPRTLNMTLGGLRDLSLIATPPAGRLSVKTFVGEWSGRGVREAVLRELRRGGQVYFVHNRVETIESTARDLRKLIPEAEIRVAHGQMSERELEQVMLDFYHRRFSMLVCSTIIESGIDIPTANTMIINRADHLGLAQLHQLRGRVGRSHHQAYAYLIAPPLRALNADAAKRLEAIAALEELGAGFTLATHDLEIRGAGELLGEEQSGQIQAIGFTLYNDLLSRAVQALRAGREPDLEDPFAHGPEIETGAAALIPEEYMPDVHMRLVHYKRIAIATTREELEELQVEMIDRFGLLPPPLKTLFAVTWIKLLAAALGVEKVQASAKGGVIRFGQHARVDPGALVKLVASAPDVYRLDGPFRLRFTWSEPRDEARSEKLEALLGRLGARVPASAPVERAAAV